MIFLPLYTDLFVYSVQSKQNVINCFTTLCY